MLVQAGRASVGRASGGQLAAFQIVACISVLVANPQVVAKASGLTGANAAPHRSIGNEDRSYRSVRPGAIRPRGPRAPL